MCERPNEGSYEGINEQASVTRSNESLYSALLIHICSHTNVPGYFLRPLSTNINTETIPFFKYLILRVGQELRLIIIYLVCICLWECLQAFGVHMSRFVCFCVRESLGVSFIDPFYG